MEKRIKKFRAWDGFNKKFSYWTMNDLCTWDTKDEKPSALDGWQEWTGLLDCNGKQIFEGDVVKFQVWKRFHEDVSELTWIVDWNEKKCGWNPMCLHTDVEDGYYNWEVENIEIIGNVFENPNLLSLE